MKPKDFAAKLLTMQIRCPGCLEVAELREYVLLGGVGFACPHCERRLKFGFQTLSAARAGSHQPSEPSQRLRAALPKSRKKKPV